MTTRALRRGHRAPPRAMRAVPADAWKLRLARVGVIAALVGLVEWLTRTGAIDPLTMPPPSTILVEAWEQLGASTFPGDLGTTVATVVLAALAGIVFGAAIGWANWRFPLLGRILDPYLIALYAVPLVVFYPTLLLVMGLNLGPMIVIAALVAGVPMSVNTAVALRAIPDRMHRLADSLGCSTWRRYRQVLAPAALPLAMPGVRLAFIYALVATIGMQFLVSTEGLGYRVSYYYDTLEIDAMWGVIFIVFCLTLGVNYGLGKLERAVRRDVA